MLRIAVCDDSTEFSRQAEQMIGNWQNRPDGTQCHVYTNGDDLIGAHRKTPFDIILLDVVMPMLNGIDAAREIRQHDRNVKIVFLTGSVEFALDSYSVKASNYLLKPVCVQKLYACLDELVEEMAATAVTVVVRGIYATHKLPLDSIEYVEAQNKHLVFSLQDGTTVETTESMHAFSEKLTVNDGFFRCHRSYIVNMNHIQTHTAGEIRMRSGSCIPIARNSHKDFQTAYFALVFGEDGDSGC